MDTTYSTNRKFKRVFANILSIFVILVIAFPAAGSASAQESSPWLIAFPDNDAVEGWEWPDGTTVTLTIDSAPGLEWSGTAAVTTWGDPRTYVRFEFGNDYNLQVGDQVTLIDEYGTTTTHTVQNLTITSVNMDEDTVAGTTDPDAQLQVWVHQQSDPPVDVTADENGNWVADLTGVYDIVFGTAGRAQIMVDSNATDVEWSAPPPPPTPWLVAYPEYDAVEGWEWPEGATVTLTINNAPGLQWNGVAHVTTWGDTRTYVRFEFSTEYDLKIGDQVTLTDEFGMTTTHTVQNLSITSVNMNEDTVAGTADPGAQLQVWAHQQTVPAVDVVAGQDGTWVADLTGVYDIMFGTGGRAQIMVDSNATDVEWSGPPVPFIAVSLTQHWFWVNNFTPETLVTFYIYENQGDEAPIFEFSRNTDASGNVTIEGWEHTWIPEPGNYMVATDGVNTKELLLAYVTLDVFDPENDIVSGHTSPGREVGIGVGNADGEQWLNVFADDSGVWTADFSTIPFDITEDMWAGGHINDEDGDATAAHNSGPSGPPEFLLYDIYIFNPESGSVKRLTKLDLMGEYNPSWSPNGKKIAHDVVDRDGSQNIYITDVKTGESTPLAGAEGGNDAAWSPNSKWIVFDHGAWSETPNIYIVPSTGGVPTLVRENAVSADWAPNGKRLVFQDMDGSIRTIVVDGGNGGETFIAASGANPSWLPDGNWIAYENNGDIWKVQVNAQGTTFGDPIQVTSGPFSDGQPTWSADSQTIVYHSGFNSDWDLWTVPAAGGMGTWLNGAPGFGDYDPAYAKNSSLIAYASPSPDGQAPRLWVSAFSYDPPAGSFGGGTHPYHFEFEWSSPEPGSWSGQGGEFAVSNGSSINDGYVLLRGPAELRGDDSPDGLVCESVDEINPDQPMRFLVGWLPDFGEITYSEAKAHFESITARAVWDDGMWADLVRHEVIPFSEDNWFQYACTFTSP